MVGGNPTDAGCAAISASRSGRGSSISTRSTPLRIGSALFHFGILALFAGHVMRLGKPKSWTEAVGITEGMYYFMAVFIGAVAGFATLVGMSILIYRRRTTAPVCSQRPPGWTRRCTWSWPS